MRLLITGGFGYLGGRLAQYLANETDHDIILGSRKKNDIPVWSPHAQVVQTLWASPEHLEKICVGVDAVGHLAGMNAQDSATNFVMALEFNAVATARLLQAAIRQDVKRFIYLSTAHVYDSPLTGVITEETCPNNLHPYATSHRAGEDVVRAANQRGEIEGIVIRLSNAYGAPVHKDANCWMLLVNDLCHQAVISKRMVLRTGYQRRDFITMTDACRAIKHLLILSIDELGEGIFNLGGQVMRVIDMTETIQARCLTVLGFTPEIICPEATPDDLNLVLDYRIDKLLATGFTLDSDLTAEIDATLIMCHIIWGAS